MDLRRRVTRERGGESEAEHPLKKLATIAIHLISVALSTLAVKVKVTPENRPAPSLKSETDPVDETRVSQKTQRSASLPRRNQAGNQRRIVHLRSGS